MHRAVSMFTCGVVVTAMAVHPSAARPLPPRVVTVPYVSGQSTDGSTINSPFFAGANGGEGFRGVAVNSAGDHLVHVSLYAPPGFNQGVLSSNGGLAIPFLIAGAQEPDLGTVSVPDATHVLESVFSTSINSNGDGALVVRLLNSGFAPVTGVYFNKSAMPIRHGQTITATGVSPGSTWSVFDSSSVVQINDGNTLLLGTRFSEGGGPDKFGLFKIQLDGSGNLVSQTLVAKEGGPVGGGPATWSSLAVNPHSIAINNSGAVLFSGITSTGVNGLYLVSSSGTGSFVAQEGGTSPVSGATWGPIAGSPVDLNNNGVWALRATLAGQDTNWTETGDAGENFSGFFSLTANGTVGGGMLRRIDGALSTDHDVDLYYIRVGNPVAAMQEIFSATTVPDPGNGFAGANFDTVLFLFRDFHNANGAFRTGVGRSDNVSDTVPQSTLGPASLPTGHTPGTAYFLGISTPKSRALGGFATANQMWADDPSAVQIAGGVMYWIDPSEGQIRRINIATGIELSPLQVGVIPPQTVGQIAEDAPILAPLLALHDTGGGGPGSKLYFLEKRFFPWRLKRCDLDGSNVETVLDSDTTPISGMNVLLIDSAGGKLYWSRPFTNGEVRRANLDGTNPELLLTLDGTRVSTMAIDPVGGKIYYHEPVANSLNRCNLDGTSPQILNIGTNATAMTVDAAGRRLYIGTTSGVIRRYNLDTSAFTTDFVTTNRTSVLTIDTAAAQVCWSVGGERRLRRAPIAGGSVEDWLSVGPDIGERPSDGQAYLDGLNGTTPFQRSGTATPGALPYQIKLTGVTAVYPLTVISRGNTKVVATGDALPSTGPDGVTTIGGLSSPIKITDNGLVAWRGRWISTVAPTGMQTALFLGRDEVVRDSTPAAGGIGGIVASLTANAYGFDVSPSGQYALLNTANGSFSGAGNNCVAVRFDSVPTAPCQADFNGSGSVTVQDIFDFLAAYFSSSPAADINGSGSVTVQDIFDFLSMYFIGC